MKRRLLYVEDDLVQANLVSPLLEEDHFTVFHVENGQAALDALSAIQFDVVLTDYYMPTMTGLDLLNTIRDHKYSIPVVVLTAASDAGVAFSVLKSGAADFIAKDASGDYLELIAPLLERAINQHEANLKTLAHATQIESEKQISYDTLDALNQGVLVLSELHQIRYCNRFLRTVFGIKDDAPLINGDLTLLASMMAGRATVKGISDTGGILQLLTAWLDKPKEPLEIVVFSNTFQLVCTQIHQTNYALTFVDITYQKSQLASLANIINQAPVAILVVDSNGNIVLANIKASELICLE